MTVDSHTHIWGSPTEDRPWTNERTIDLVDRLNVERAYTADALARDMDQIGVEEAILVSFPIAGQFDNQYVIDAITSSDAFHGIGVVDPFTDDLGEQVRSLMAINGMLGVRLYPIFPADGYVEAQMDPSADWLPSLLESPGFWEAIDDTDAVVQTLIDVSQLDQLLTLVEQHPDVHYLVDHLARMDPARDGVAPFEPLAEYENVLMKVSAVPFLSNESFPYHDIHDVLRTLLDTFGRERLAWGSDYPVMSTIGTYGETLNWLDTVDGLSTADSRWLKQRSIRRHCPRYRK